MNGLVTLGHGDLALASVFLVANGALSLWLGLGLERRLAVAAARMFVQLTLVGLLLKVLFAMTSPWLLALVLGIMVVVAGREARARQESPLKGWLGYGIVTGSIGVSAGIVGAVALAVLVRPDPWWSPQYALPLMGMILGNALTGVSLFLDNLHRAVRREARAIEARLMLGETARVAMQPFMRAALRSGFMPLINAMAVMGVVSLPGMMSGQILAGTDPVEAVKYQILVMLLIAGASGTGILLAALGSFRALSDARHRLRPDRLTMPDKRR